MSSTEAQCLSHEPDRRRLSIGGASPYLGSRVGAVIDLLTEALARS